MCLRSNCGWKVVYRNELEIGNLFGLYRFNVPKESGERKYGNFDFSNKVE